MLVYNNKTPERYTIIENKGKRVLLSLNDLNTLTQLEEQYSYQAYEIELMANFDYINSNYEYLLEQARKSEINELSCVIRAKRDKLLADTDWTQTLDCPLSAETKEKYRIYRQALRDIPEQNGFPYNVEFPEVVK